MTQIAAEVASKSIVSIEDVDWLLMGMQAPELCDDEVDYGGKVQMATKVEVDEAVAEEGVKVGKVVAAVDVTSPGCVSPPSAAQRTEESR